MILVDAPTQDVLYKQSFLSGFFFGGFFFFFCSFDRVLGPGVCFGIALIVVLGLQSSKFV